MRILIDHIQKGEDGDVDNLLCLTFSLTLSCDNMI